VRAHRFPILFSMLLAGCVERTDAESPKAPRLAGAAVPRESPAGPLLAISALAVVAAAPLSADSSAPAETTTLTETKAPQPEPRIVLAAGGDVNFGRECGQAILKDVSYDPFAGLSEAWSSADLRFANLESQLSDQHGLTQSPAHRLIFTGPPGGADVLSHARLSVVSTANNHAWDYGKSALFETIANLERAQVPFAGTGRDAEQAYRPAVLRVSGRTIALFAVTHIWNQGDFEKHEGRDFVAWANADKLKAGIEQARREHDFVLVSYHGGEEYVDAPVERTRHFVQAMMALGVDAVIGHHPHVMQGIGWAEGRPILYSLGNFVFAGHDERPWTKQSFFARITLEKGKTPELAACPFAIDGHRPRSFDKTREALAIERFRLHLIGTSITVGGSDVAHADELGCVRVTPKAAASQSSLSSSN
jgi:poly-gamma-glutamate capsule biosynthesis protein CapA/YwtB (metallophosphatase superfamily)